ncbi:MAG: PAS domain-containing sensor histidine kinase [Candidatus Krumholzibacteriia bacterium]
MILTRASVLPAVGAGCLVGQGILLGLGAVAAPGAGGAVLPGRALFLLLTVLLAVALSFCRQASGRTFVRRLGRAGTLAGISALLALALWDLAAPGAQAPAADSPQKARQLAAVERALGGLDARCDAVAAELEAALRPAAAATVPIDGATVRVLTAWQERWQAAGPAGRALPLTLVLWRDGERVAWGAGAQPLPAPAPGDTALLLRPRQALVYRRFERWEDTVLECQVALGGAGWREAWPGWDMAAPGATPGLERQAAVGGPGGPQVMLAAAAVDAAAPAARAAARRLLAALAAWVLVAAGFAGICGRGLLWLLPLWVGRGLLAAVDVHPWLAAAWPVPDSPARPGSLASLVDPAYFATPILGGWFASAADALVTAGLLALTVWHLLQRAGPSAAAAPRGRGPVAGLVFGLGAGSILQVLALLTSLLATNANPRLSGPGVSLDHLSFWVLHAALMLLSLSLAVVAVRVAAGGGGPARDRRAGWLGGGLLAAVGAALVAVLAAAAPVGAVLPAVLAAALWGVAPGLARRAGLSRRLVWPMVVILVTVWNHAVLRQVYAAGERAWLEGKAQVIAESDSGWRRFLLGAVLQDMATRDEAPVRPAGPADLWRLEPAWVLWEGSALRDLGIPCLVDILDPDERSLALHATGFMRDVNYEVIEREPWQEEAGEYGAEDPDLYFRSERRLYAGGAEEVLVGEIARRGGAGWLHAEIPVRSWRVSTLLAEFTGGREAGPGRYRPRSEIDRPVLLLHADDNGWLDAGDSGFPGPGSEAAMAALRSGAREWAELEVGGRRWLCRWQPLPPSARRSPGEGFVLGLAQPGAAAALLDLSRLLLLNLVLLAAVAAAVQVARAAARRLGDDTAAGSWRAGFQERFLAGYLVLGLVLLVLVGASVDRVTHQRIAGEASARARAGLLQAVDQLRTLLAEQARTMAASEYIAELLEGQLTGARPVGPLDRQQGMVFAGDGSLLLDETLGNLDQDEAAGLLAAARRAPLIVQRDGDDLFVGTVIPLDLGGLLPAGPEPAGRGDDGERTDGFFFYRQRVDSWLLFSLADLIRGEITLRFDGQPLLASHPGTVFSGRIPPLTEPELLEPMLDHPAAPSVLAAVDRPFALTGCQPLPAFLEPAQGGLVRRAVPALLTVTFPDREREYAEQRRETALFLAGLANLILLTALLLAVLMSWNIFRPVRLLVAATRSLAAGDFGAPLPEAGRDEVGRLADAFGRMRGELRSARDRLAARERFLATVLDRVTVGVAVVDARGQVAVLNPAGRRILAGFHPELPAEAAVVRLREQLATGDRDRGPGAGQLRGADGRRTLRGAVAPLDLPDGRTDTMLVFEDVTGFLEAQKLAINAELARQVAHEIKNPLTPIQLSVQLLRQAWRDRHPQVDRIVEETVDRVLAQVELLRTIAAEFSLLGRPGDLGTAAVDLAALVAEATAAYTGGADRAAAAPRVGIDPDAPPPVLAHAESLRKIVGNLMQNSLDAARDGGPVTVTVRWRVEPRSVTMVWRDDGTGIPDQVADRLFDPYFSTKSAGTGLGLAICRNLADRMGGRITLGNRDDGPGAVAELTLRRAPGDEERAP